MGAPRESMCELYRGKSTGPSLSTKFLGVFSQSCLKFQDRLGYTRSKLINIISYTNYYCIKGGILQGGILGPLWFCPALKQLTGMMRQHRKGYLLDINERNLRHLWYIDLKIYTSKNERLQTLLQSNYVFIRDIGLKIELEKCRTNIVTKGKWTHYERHPLSQHKMQE